ncbi:helix-turn-helix transcriptional regulator [Staphylococcus simulans]|uniref:helix-turn-helix transcriptional regulator n=1 Tax=Staphylococcus simulans TaxID=1286 RepID=UPI0021D42964|nr:helix-turn-helix transcriptional regulator [Staphylococcus simulans]UXR32410.1 helix-turn-helix transcriptional regulator [Staphylococcus simulans]
MVNKIKKIRLSKGITITQLSKKTGLSRNAIYKLEDGNTNPSLETIKKISYGLDEMPSKIFNLNVIQELQKEA